MRGDKGDVAKKLDELVNSYSAAGRRENESERLRSLSQQKHENDLAVDREKLIENGVPIDPELIKQVAGKDITPVTFGDKKPTKTKLRTSTGEVIDTKKSATETPKAGNGDATKRSTDANTVFAGSDSTVSRRTEAEVQKEIDQVMRRAHRKYGGEKYNRLDPASYDARGVATRKLRSNASSALFWYVA